MTSTSTQIKVSIHEAPAALHDMASTKAWTRPGENPRADQAYLTAAQRPRLKSTRSFVYVSQQLSQAGGALHNAPLACDRMCAVE